MTRMAKPDRAICIRQHPSDGRQPAAGGYAADGSYSYLLSDTELGTDATWTTVSENLNYTKDVEKLSGAWEPLKTGNQIPLPDTVGIPGICI